jgi:hypothetical protein
MSKLPRFGGCLLSLALVFEGWRYYHVVLDLDRNEYPGGMPFDYTVLLMVVTFFPLGLGILFSLLAFGHLSFNFPRSLKVRPWFGAAACPLALLWSLQGWRFLPVAVPALVIAFHPPWWPWAFFGLTLGCAVQLLLGGMATQPLSENAEILAAGTGLLVLVIGVFLSHRRSSNRAVS